MYSKEEIEKKRQHALQLKKDKTLSNIENKESIGTSKGIISFSNQNWIPGKDAGKDVSKHFTNFINKTSISNIASPQHRKAYGYSKNKSQSIIKQQSTTNRYNPIGNSNKFYGKQQLCEATCSMINNFRFSVETTTFCPQLIELFKTIPSKLYDAKDKTWNFHINDYNSINEKIISLKSDVSFKGLPSFVLKIFINLLQEKKGEEILEISRIDSNLVNSLYPFQKDGIEYGISRNGKCLIADDMGLGKTRQALGIAAYYKNEWPLLIVTPSSVRYQWSEAILENLSSVPAQYIQHIISTKDYIEKSKIIILSYDLLVRRIDEIAARKFGVLICDESHYLKNGKTQRTKSIQRLANNIRRIVLLTGTPALSRPIELYPQIKLLIPGFLSYHDFGIRYCAGFQTSYGWDFTGSSNLKELEILLKAICLIRRLKKDVMTQLPSKIRQKIILDPNLIKSATKEMEAVSSKMETSRGSQKHSVLLQYYSETSKAKEKAVCNYISDLIENQEKFLLFAHHKNIMDSISKLLVSKKILFVRIDGHTNPEKRKEFVDEFQQNENVMVAVLSITAANAGVTLTASRLVVFAELYWNPGILCQAEDRVHRIGQTDNVVIRYLLAKGTSDDYMWPAIQKKIDVLNEVGLDQNFELNETNVEKQTATFNKSETLDDFIVLSPVNKSANSLLKDSHSDLQTSSGSLKDLLDVDDDAFDSIDLDNIV